MRKQHSSWSVVRIGGEMPLTSPKPAYTIELRLRSPTVFKPLLDPAASRPLGRLPRYLSRPAGFHKAKILRIFLANLSRLAL